MKRPPSVAGFSLVELLVAVTLLGIALAGAARLSFVMARRSYPLVGLAARDAVIAQQVNQFTALPFDSLTAKVGTTTVRRSPLPYTRTVTVEHLSPRWRRVTLIITPLNPFVSPDTVIIERAKPDANPFNKP
ncbi:MAG TPA: prepilin-type N-terminal cleavage/methylation domain-containing protein [Gemmatimonadales bacterium]|nr:prepilin-type N-terminal cleavage/methylation domain-containing protein [Gemmatimonadales bacterium]